MALRFLKENWEKDIPVAPSTLKNEFFPNRHRYRFGSGALGAQKYFYRYRGLFIKEYVFEDSPSEDALEGVLREALVGMKLNKINSLALVTTYGYFVVEDSEGMEDGEAILSVIIVLEHVEGELFSSFLSDKTIPNRDIERMIAVMLIQLYDLNQHVHFTHYDLHPENIMIRMRDEKDPAHYRFGEHKIITYFDVVFIDFGRSYVEGYPSSFIESGYSDSGVVSGIYDPLIDYMYLLKGVIDRYEENFPTWMSDFMVRNGYSPDGSETLNDFVGYPTNVIAFDQVLTEVSLGLNWGYTVTHDGLQNKYPALNDYTHSHSEEEIRVAFEAYNKTLSREFIDYLDQQSRAEDQEISFKEAIEFADQDQGHNQDDEYEYNESAFGIMMSDMNLKQYTDDPTFQRLINKLLKAWAFLSAHKIARLRNLSNTPHEFIERYLTERQLTDRKK